MEGMYLLFTVETCMLYSLEWMLLNRKFTGFFDQLHSFYGNRFYVFPYKKQCKHWIFLLPVCSHEHTNFFLKSNMMFDFMSLQLSASTRVFWTSPEVKGFSSTIIISRHMYINSKGCSISMPTSNLQAENSLLFRRYWFRWRIYLQKHSSAFLMW